MEKESHAPSGGIEREDGFVSWASIENYIREQSGKEEEFWIQDYFELIDTNGASILDAEKKRIIVELGCMALAGQSVPMIKMSFLPVSREQKKGARRKKIEGSIIKPLSSFAAQLPGQTIAGVRKVEQVQLEAPRSTVDRYSTEKETKRVEASDVHKAQRKVIAFLLDSGNTIVTTWGILQTGSYGPKLSRGELIKLIYDEKDAKGFIAANAYFDLPQAVIKTLTELAKKIQPVKKYGLSAEALKLDSEAQKKRRKSFELDPGKYDLRWTEEVLLMTAQLSAAKVPHDIAARIVNAKLEEKGHGPLRYSELGQVYTRVFFRDPHQYIQERAASGTILPEDLQNYIDTAVSAYRDQTEIAREKGIAMDVASTDGDFEYDYDALKKLSDQDRELLFAWNEGKTSHIDLAEQFNIKSNRLNLKIAAFRAAGYPVREGSAMKTLVERIKIDVNLDTSANPDVYEYDPERLRDLPEAAQWLIRAWNRGGLTLNMLAQKAGINTNAMQAYLSQLRQRQYPVRVGEGKSPLSGMRTRPVGATGMRTAQAGGAEELDQSFRKLLQHPILPREEQRELVRRWQEGSDDAARERLVRHYYRFIAKIANRYRKYGVDMADLMSFGADGLLRAIDRFDLKQDFALSTYSAWWIRSRIVRGIQDESRLVRLPVHLQTGGESGNDVGVSVVGFEDLAASKDTKGGTRDLDTLPELLDESMVSEQSAIEARQVAEGWKEVLNERELDIVTRRFFGEETLEEIGQDPRYHVSRERIRQIEEVALEKLRALLGIEIKEKQYRRTDREGAIDRFVELSQRGDDTWKNVLGEREIALLTQRFTQNQSQQNVARVMGISVDSLKTIESAALKKIEIYLEFLDDLME